LLILFPAAPLACVMNVEFSIIISSRVNDIRAAQQLGTMVILPLVAIFILAQTNAFAIDPFHLLIISGILLLADVALFYVSRTTFEREEILTKWK
jgi:phosphoglycerol transferase MdoB-like AlkP superfamily enzyme